MIRSTRILAATTAILAMALGSTGQAATLSGTYNADDYATVYLSTDLVADPTELISDKTTLWNQGNESFSSVALSPGQDYYLLVRAQNVYSGPAMFIGEFVIDGTGFQFGNGASTLMSNTTDWRVSQIDFASAAATPVSLGTNTGLQIWGSRPGIDGSAEAIWAYYADWANGYNGPAYFVAQIAAVPEPESWALFCAGVALLAGLTRRTRT